MRSSVLRAGTLSQSFLLLAALPVRAQAPPMPTPPRREAPPPRSGIAHDFMTWLGHLTGTGNNHRPSHVIATAAASPACGTCAYSY